MRSTSRALLMVAVLLTGLMATASPAFADLDAGAGSIVKKPVVGGDDGSDHDGDADSDRGTSYDEDNDSNDGTANNVEDDGDNAHPSGKDRSVESGGSGTQGKSESNPDDSKGPQRYEGARGDDKANGPGGTDLADQDGNNGCGNDDDFDDDNNGWCGKPRSKDDDVQSSEDDAKSGGEAAGKITICHATGSATNPFVEITISENGLSGHGDHEGDIIPMPAGGCDEGDDDVLEREDDVLGRADQACPAGTVNAGKAMDAADCDEDDSVLGKVLQRSGVLGTAVKRASTALGAVLPFTGNGDVMAFLVLALGLIAGGVFLLLKRKKA